MASKQELETQVKEQELKIKELESLLSQGPVSETDIISLRARVEQLEGTNRALVEQLNTAQTDAAESNQLLTKSGVRIAQLLREAEEREADAALKQHEDRSKGTKDEDGEVMTAKDIARATGLRNIPEDALFRRLT